MNRPPLVLNFFLVKFLFLKWTVAYIKKKKSKRKHKIRETVSENEGYARDSKITAEVSSSRLTRLHECAKVGR